MNVTIKKTTKPCFLCGKTSQAVEAKFKDGTFTGVLCKDHLFERLDAKSAVEAPVKAAPAK